MTRARWRLGVFRHPAARYAFGAAVVSAAYRLRVLAVPYTGTGAPFVLFFAAVLATALFAGTGPGVLVLAVSAVVGAREFVVTAGYSPTPAVWQAILFTVDGLVVVYLSFLMSRARRTAEASEARVRDLVELAPDAFLLADRDARLVEVNLAACAMLGYEREELIGKAIRDIVPPEGTAHLLPSVKADLFVPGTVTRGEWTLRRKNGTYLPVEVSSTIRPDGRWQAFVRDISERKRIEDERHVYVALLDNAPDFIGIADPKGVPIYVNPAGRRMIGMSLDYPVENTEIPQYYTPDQRTSAAEVIVRSMVERGRWSGETTLRNWQTEEPIPVSDEHFMIRDPRTGRVLGMGTVIRDISRSREIARDREDLLARERLAREQAEAAREKLRESEERFRLTVDEAPIGMALVALDGRFVRVNRALCEIVGYTKDELERLTFKDITHPEDLAVDVSLADRLARGEIPRYQLEKRYIRKDGGSVTIMLSASILRSSDGRPLYYIAQIEDISERTRAQEALHASERDFRSLAESMPQIVWATTAEGLNIYFNHQWVDYTGLTLEESYGEGWIIPFHPDDRQRAWEAWQRATRHRDARASASYLREIMLRMRKA